MKIKNRKKNGTELNDITMLRDDKGSRYESKDNRLVIKRITTNDEGIYTCYSSETKESADIHVIGTFCVE